MEQKTTNGERVKQQKTTSGERVKQQKTTNGERGKQQKKQETQAVSEKSSPSGQLERAMKTLEDYVTDLSLAAGKTTDYAKDLWGRMRISEGVLRELAYFHDYGEFYGKYQVAGYTLTDILVWQVDHFKAYMDRHEEMNRYRTERLLLESLDVLLKMEVDPVPYVEKMQGETGTDYADKY